MSQMPSQLPPPMHGSPPAGPPVLTKAYGSLVCGMLSLPSCFCFAVPSLILGGLAIWLGVWVKRNYRGNTASEIANLLAVFGIVFGSIGVLLGVIGVGMMIIGGLGALADAARQARP